MSRLINADKLQEDLEKVKKESASLVDISHIIGFQSVVDAQPTAFDVDKVIANLEAQAERQLQRGIQENESACLYASSCYSVAVDVVKAGGSDVLEI